ncbi:hypothetical protein [Methylophaga sp.]|uniref:hypothetical protein n=1 Tax=Methylophaga sp. TaxID=2024840 RepID=UPI003A947E05
MNLKQLVIAASLLAFSGMLQAFETDQQRIEHNLKIMDSGSVEQKEQMLERLQWSGLSDPLLFDRLEQDVLAAQETKYFERDELSVLSYEMRALGYSGNAKYQPTLQLMANKAENSKLKRHASKAKTDLVQFQAIQNKLATVNVTDAGLPAEVVSYIKLLETNDAYAQRLAARAIFHEQRKEPALLEVTAAKLEAMYMDTNLDKTAQDSAAWMCKALKQAGGYESLLQKVASDTPHKKIKKYAS